MQLNKKVFFNDRDGHTVLSEKEKKGLKLTHITNMRELDTAEQMNISTGLLWLQTQSTKDFLHEDFFFKLHSKLFNDVWKWAGSYRTSEKNIGIEAWRVPTEMHKFLNDVAYWLEYNSFPDWAEFLAHFHHKLVYIHPFPNGNGRFSRIITNYLCRVYERPLPSWHAGKSPAERRKLYIDALRKADQKNYTDLTSFFKV